MNFSDVVTTAKSGILQELGRKRKWQTYVVALGLTLCFFLVVGNVLGESSTAPEPEKVAKVETPDKVKGFQLTDNTTKDKSAWEVSTGADAPPETGPGLARPEAKVFEPSVESDTVGPTVSQVVQIAADKAESREPIEENPLNDVEQASLVATEFYNALNEGKVGQAYDKLAPEFQQDLPFENFQYGYSAVESISCEVKNSEQISPVQIRLDVQINAYEAGADNTYYATCILQKTNNEWTLAGVAQLAAL